MRGCQNGRTSACALRSDPQHVPGLERPHLSEDRARRKRVAEAEEVVDAVARRARTVVREARAAP